MDYIEECVDIFLKGLSEQSNKPSKSGAQSAEDVLQELMGHNPKVGPSELERKIAKEQEAKFLEKWRNSGLS